LEIDTQYILFLFNVWESYNARSVLVGHKQGAYYVPSTIINEEYLVEYDNVTLELESVCEDDPIILTIEDLIEIAEYNDLLTATDGDDE